MDALHGLKYIYSEAILPDLDKCFLSLLSDIRSKENKLLPKEKERNKIHFSLYRM